MFFIIRAAFEYIVDIITCNTFGSDGMAAINFGGVLMHEVCLSVMITSIKHPLVFVSLVMSDVLENAFCMWSLAKGANSKRISPEDDEAENLLSSRSLTRRSSTMFSLLTNKSNLSDKGTALFIAATLLQREAVETLVPIQASALLTFLYKIKVKSNSIVSGWNDEDWRVSMKYLGIDLAVEIVVFVCTIMSLRRIYPEFHTSRILRGLLRMHWVEMSVLSFAVFLGNLAYQSTYSGMDMSMKFSWLSCDGHENSTWIGGFEWEC